MNEYNNHTFVVCAYKESKYLEKCIDSLKKQSVKSRIIMSTSTPNVYIKKIAEKYGIKLYINTGKSGIGEDWNFGVSCTDTELVTIAHQDDVYKENYLEEIINLYNKNPYCSIYFGDYREIKNDNIIGLTRNLKIKKKYLRHLVKSKQSLREKQQSIKYGNSICCPCVTLNIKVVKVEPFKVGMKSNLDWYTWYEFSKLPNDFGYINKELMYHRIHEESETSNLIENSVRLNEDYEMLKKFWPTPIAKVLMYFYKKAIKTNS